MTIELGGHSFQDGICVLALTGGEREGQRCGRRLVDLSWVTRDNVGEEGIAHVGLSNLRECSEIEDYFIAHFARSTSATRELSGGHTPSANPIEVGESDG
jgi:hypothetical protein